VIFVTLGTNEAPFDRLVRAVELLPSTEAIVVQVGASAVRPPNALCVEELPFEALAEHVRRARVVVTHAGVGSVLVALTNGKRPVVVPRRAAHGEAVDDHQVDFACRFAEAGLVTVVDDPIDLAAAVVDVPEVTAHGALGTASGLTAELHAYMQATIAAA
jgi:UDP-N-acetylglucosamine--N-acetylmuramyl-(pentapeptide) pyrophosphoryl-undecaprenol N-acetylglucosamine transferase